MTHPHPSDAELFGNRLRLLMREAGHMASPTVLANEFNLLYWGEGITSHAARNWLNGVSLPKPDKLRVLADWLQVRPQYLLFGEEIPGHTPRISDDAHLALPAMADDTMLFKYHSLAHDHRRMVREVVAGLYQLRDPQRTLIPPDHLPDPSPRAAPRKPRRRKPQP
jgi:transcriptional regulator with XRE-family HTH domain